MKSKKESIEELNRVMQRFGTLTVLHTNAVAHKIGISATEFEAMDIISHNQPITAGRLAVRCGLTTGAITGIVDRLERAGLVKRVRDPEDRRRVLLEPVEDEEKKQKVRELYQPISRAFDELIKEYTPERLQFLVDVHNEMGDRMEEIIEELRKSD